MQRTAPRLIPRLLLAPAVLTLFLWMIVPLVMTVYFSLIRYNLMQPDQREVDRHHPRHDHPQDEREHRRRHQQARNQAWGGALHEGLPSGRGDGAAYL